MITDTEKEQNKIYLSYNKILYIFKCQNIKTKAGNDITNKDLRQAVNIMVKKHPTCNWKQKKVTGKRYYILIEGFYWLKFVYFQNKKKLVDADIDFFIERIQQYEDLLKIGTKSFWNENLEVYSLQNYFNRVKGTIKNNIIKMNKLTNDSYIYYENEKQMISKEGIEWLCKNCFKQKYLELLEQYKTELTKIYIERGFPYNVI